MDTHAIRRVIARVPYPYGSVRTVRRGPAAGARFRVARGMGFSYAMDRYGMPFGPVLDALDQVAPRVLDIGANVGQFAVYVATAVPGVEMVSIEAVPEVYGRLVDNLRLNTFPSARAVCVALSDVDRVTGFQFDPARPTKGRLSSRGGYGKSSEQWVQARRLDSLLAELSFEPNFIKLDVEGAGQQVVRGAHAMISALRPTIYYELHSEDEALSAAELISDGGYRAVDMAGDPVEVQSFSSRAEIMLLPK